MNFTEFRGFIRTENKSNKQSKLNCGLGRGKGGAAHSPQTNVWFALLADFFCHFSHCGAWFQTTMKVKQFMQDHKGKFLPHQHFCNELHPCKPCLLFLSLRGDFLGCLNRPLQNIRQGKSIEQKLNVAKNYKSFRVSAVSLNEFIKKEISFMILILFPNYRMV